MPINLLKEATAALVGEWHHTSSSPVLHPCGYTGLGPVKVTQIHTPSSHFKLEASTPVSCPEKPVIITTWISYINSSLCFSHSEPFSSFHAPNTPKQSAFPLPSACPSLCFWHQSDLQQGLPRKVHSDTQHKEGSSVTQWESKVSFWGSRECSVSPI